MSQSSVDSGNGRLWERFQLHDINDRIENIYQHFLDRGLIGDPEGGSLDISASEQQQYLDKIRSAITDQLNDVMTEMEVKFNDRSKQWRDENVKLKGKVNEFEAETRSLTRENEGYAKENQNLRTKYKNLRQGIDGMMKDHDQKNVDRIKKLTQQLRDAESDRAATIQQSKKDLKAAQEAAQEQREKMEKMERKMTKMKNDKQEWLADKETLNNTVSNLERIIKDNKDGDTGLLEEQLEETQTELEKIQRALNDLKDRNTELDDENGSLQEKLQLEKDTFRRFMQQQHSAPYVEGKELTRQELTQREEMRNLRAELSREYENQLKQREKAFSKAKNDAIKILDAEYNDIKQGLDDKIQSLEDNNNALKKQLTETRGEVQRLKAANNKMDALKEEMGALQEQIAEKASEIIKLKTELSKYKILWQHFFGLDQPLRDEIERVNNKLDKFETHHGIQSPIPKKKRRVIVESLSQLDFKKPLGMDAIPSPNDEYMRFELYNVMEKQRVLEMKGFKLRNDRGVEIPIPENSQINPGQCLGICLKKKKKRTDILYDQSTKETFCNFQDGEVIWLCDAFDEKVQLFPITELIFDSLSSFVKKGEPPIYVKRVFDEDSGYRGFEFGNSTKNKLKFKGMHFRNKRKTLKMNVPMKALRHNGIIKLVITDNPNHHRIRKNDLIVSPDKITTGDDALYLCDSFGNEIELYTMEGGSTDKGARGSGRMAECFIM